jgi:microcystin-dependent protein
MEPYIGEIKMFAYGTIPRGWSVCDGKILSMSQFSALFSLIGTQYGGNGTTTFALPDLRGRVPMHIGSTIRQGQLGGKNTVTLTAANLPQHTHNVQVTNVASNAPTVANSILCLAEDKNFAPLETNALVPMATTTIGSVGNNAPVSNMQPFIGLTFCIATTGIYPSRG